MATWQGIQKKKKVYKHIAIRNCLKGIIVNWQEYLKCLMVEHN